MSRPGSGGRASTKPARRVSTQGNGGPGRPRRYAPRLPPEERREQLLDAALRLIATRGYGGVSMEGVAREAGVTKPVVYDMFGGLEKLLRALREREEKGALEELSAAVPRMPAGGDPDELLVQGALAFLRAVAANPDRWRLILLPLEGTPDTVRKQVEDARRAIVRQLEDLVAWGLRERGSPEELDVELAAEAIAAAAENGGRLLLTDPRRFTPDRLATFVSQLVGALGRPDAKQRSTG